MLRLCAWVFAGVSAEHLSFDARETYFLKALQTRGQYDSNLLAKVRDALQSGACYPHELAFALKNEKNATKIESSESSLHQTREREVRGDLLFVEYDRFRLQIQAASMESLLESEHGLRVRKWLRSHRAYECTHCGRTRRGFSLICAGCSCFDIGSPVQLSLHQSGELAMPIFDVDLFEVECMYWMSLLQAT